MRSVWLARSRLIALGTLALVVSASLVVGFTMAGPVAAHGPGRRAPRVISPPTTSWKLVSSPNVGGTTSNNYLLGLAPVSSSDLWAVGCSSCDLFRAGATLIEQWNGKAWSVVASPNPGNAADLLQAAAADSATDVWAVGYQIVSGVGTDMTLVEHYDGNSWQSVLDARPSGVSSLYGVSALSASDVWAVGLNEQQVGLGNASTFIEHFDGTQWTQSASPSPAPYNGLNAVAADSASDVWAVGYELNGSLFTPLVERFDGSKWSVSSLPASLTSLNGLFNSVDALATNNVWAAGEYSDPSTGYIRTLVAHWNGSSWSRVPSPNPSTDSELFGIAAMSPTSIWATGSEYGGGFAPAGPLTEYWNGCQWSVVPATSANSLGNTLRAVAAGLGLSAPWAVGDYAAGATGAFEKTLTETFTGQAPTGHPSLAVCPQMT